MVEGVRHVVCGNTTGGESRRSLSRYDYAHEFNNKMREGERAGLTKYGSFDPETDRRVLTVEAQEETRDVGVYMTFLQRKHPNIREEAAEIKRMAFNLFVALRQLESRERGLSENRHA